MSTMSNETQVAIACRSDGRCQYAIDHGAEGLGHCLTGTCVLPKAALTDEQIDAGSDISAAEDELLRNVDTLQDWLCDACIGKPVQPWSAQIRELDPTCIGTVALVAFAFDRGQKQANRIAALNELADRFLQDNSVHVLARASELADERIADEKEVA